MLVKTDPFFNIVDTLDDISSFVCKYFSHHTGAMETVSKIPVSDVQRVFEDPSEQIVPPVPHRTADVDTNVEKCK